MLAAMLREIHHDIRALARGDREAGDGYRRGQKPLVRSDLLKRLAIAERQKIKPRIGSVQYTEAVLARLHIEIRKQPAVDKCGVSGVLGYPGRIGEHADGIVDLPVGPDHAIHENQRNFVLALGKIQRVFEGVANHVQARHAGADVQPVDAHGMVVIPEQRGVLRVRIVVSGRLARRIRVFRPAVALRRDSGAVNMHDRARFGTAFFRAHEVVIDGEKMLRGQLVRPFDENFLAAAGFDGGTWNAVTVAPKTGGRRGPGESSRRTPGWESGKREPGLSGRD